MEIARNSDPREHAAQIREHLDHTVQHLKEAGRRVDDPRARALFETGAEVVQGLRTAIQHYESGAEEAWK